MVDSGGGRFVYCSTLATYMYSLDGYKLEKLIAAHERTITGLCFNPSNSNQFVTCALDLRLLKWDVREEKEIAFAKVPHPPAMIDWCAHEDGLTAVIVNKTVMLWDTVKNNVGLQPLEPIAGLPQNVVTRIRWNHKKGGPARLAVGCADGTVLVWSKSAKLVTIKPPSDRDEKRPNGVTDLQWDPLSNSYLLATYSDGYMSLLDGEGSSGGGVLSDFPKQSVDIAMAAWVNSMPGAFITVNERAPVLSLWNVSQK